MKRNLKLLLAGIACVPFLLGFSVSASAQSLPAAVDGMPLPTLADIVEQVEHGVVNISTRNARNDGNFMFDEDGAQFFRRFFDFPDFPQMQPRRRNRIKLGSGVVFDAKQGYVITNKHVLAEADEIAISLVDGRSFRAEVIGSDNDMDVAVLKIEADSLTELPIGNSDELRVGDFVLAFGTQFGFSATVTSGIVSALGRHGLGVDKYENFIQTDAAINPGSSGGALVNLRGELVGINTAIYAPTGGNVGIGFAIPINAAFSIAQQIVEHGQVKRGLLGVRFQELTPELAGAFGLKSVQGVLVNSVVEDSAAMQAGLQEGDILTHVNDIVIEDGVHLRNVIALIRVGETVRVKYFRNGAAYESMGLIAQRGASDVAGESVDIRFSGAAFKNMDGESRGVLVAELEEDSAASYLGIQKGDVIVEVNKRKVENVSDFENALGRHSQRVLLKLLRDGQSIFVVFS